MRVGKDKFKKRRSIFTVLILFSFILTVLPGGMNGIRADELESEVPVETVELGAEVIWTGVPDEMEIPDTTLHLMTGEEVVESMEINDGSTVVKFAPVNKFNDAGEEILYSVSQDSLENFTTVIEDFVIENTYVEPVVAAKVVEEPVEEPKAEEPIEEPKIEESVEEPVVEEPVEEPKVEEPLEEPKVEEPVVEPKEEEVVEEPVEEPKAEEPVEEPLEDPIVKEAPQESPKTAVDGNSIDLKADIGIMALPGDDGVFYTDDEFEMIETEFDSTNDHSYVKYIWVDEDGVLFMAITALNYIQETPEQFYDVSINDVYPSGAMYYGVPNDKYQDPIYIDDILYSPIFKDDMAFWVVIYFEPDNMPPLYDEDNSFYYNSTLGVGHDVLDGSFNVVRTNYTFVVEKNWLGGDPTTRPEVTFNINFGGVTDVTTNPLTGTMDGTAEGIAVGGNQGETEPWVYTWQKVPKTNAYGQLYTYTVTENPVDGYTTTGPTGPVKSSDGLTWTYEFTNSHILDVTAYKIWDGGPKPSVYFQLWQKIGEVESVVPDLELEEITSTDLEATWDDLPEYSGTTPIFYFVKEVNKAGNDYTPPNYEKSYSEEDRLTITNRYSSPLDDVTATKTWTGGPSELWYGIDLMLYRTIDWNDGEPVNPEEIEADPTITPRAGMPNIWDYLWEDLEVTDHDGNVYFYYVVEPIVPDNYDSVAEGLSVVNTYSSPLTDIVARKIWVNGDPLEHIAVTFDLYRRIEGEEPINLTELEIVADPDTELVPGTITEYKYTWSDLPEFDNDGNPYIYSVDEPDIPVGYDKSVSTDGLAVTNTAKTSDLQLMKTDDSEEPKPLEGAEFELYKKVTDPTGAVAFDDGFGGTIYGIRINDDTYPDGRLKTGIDGKTQIIEDLLAGDYFVIEVVAPTGYKIHEYPIEFTVVTTTTLNEFTILNELAPMIPATGGMGTWLFTILGIGIMGGSLLGFRKFNHKDKGKGENIMKSRKLFTFVFSMLVLFVFAAPSVVKAAPRNSGTTDVTIHKMELYTDPGEALPKDHDGKELSEAELDSLFGMGKYEPLDGVTFTYWEITKDKDLSDFTGMDANDMMTNGYGPGTEVGPTVDGEVFIEDLEDGYYYFMETGKPVNVVDFVAVPFILGLPVMNSEGTDYITDLHIYPKNVTIRGAVVLTKWVAGENDMRTPLADALFRLYAGDPESETWTEYVPEALYETDQYGVIYLNNLPQGDYFFVETAAPPSGTDVPYVLNSKPIIFSITANGKVTFTGGQRTDTGTVVDVDLENFSAPDIDKSVGELGEDELDEYVGEDFKFFIEIDLPGDIASYESLDVTDVIDTRLDYLGNVVVKGFTGETETILTLNTEYTATYTAGTRTLVVSFVPAKLDGFTSVEISFEAEINDTAFMGRGIENEAILDYDNSYDTGMDKDNVFVYTGGRRFIKVDEITQAPLDGAQFIIVDSENLENYLTLIDGEYGWATLDPTADLTTLPDAVELTSDADGIFEILGLKYGTYYLYETVAPMSDEGYPYNLIDDPIEFEIDAMSYYTNPEVLNIAELVTLAASTVPNVLGPQIPQTGGIGTVLFTLIGGGLMGSALILNKKRSRS